MYRTMRRIRSFEEAAHQMYTQGLMPGLAHLYIGEEAVAVGVCEALETGDYITSTHRGHGHVIAKGCDVRPMMAEILGKRTGYCKGKGGSMHIASIEHGVIGTGARMLMRDRNYLSLLLMRILVIANAVAMAFYVPYGVERLGAIGMSGIFVGFLQGSRLLSSTVWGRLSDVRGSRSCLLWGGVFFVLAPIAALLAPRLPETFRWPIHGASVALDLPLCMYLLALCIFGVALQANLVGRGAFIIEAADPARRPSYIAFQNAVAFPFTFLPAIAGWIIGDSTSGLDYLFLFAVFTGVLTFFAAFRLTEVRKVGGVR